LSKLKEYLVDRPSFPPYGAGWPVGPSQPTDVKHATGKPLGTQVGGDHYSSMKIEPVEFIHANNLDFFQGNIIKYASRYKKKNGVEDLLKIIHYAQMVIDKQYNTK
jgi:hypothetical protein